MQIELTCSECGGPIEGKWNSTDGGITVSPCAKCSDDLKEIVEDNKKDVAALRQTIKQFKDHVKDFHGKLEEVDL